MTRVHVGSVPNSQFPTVEKKTVSTVTLCCKCSLLCHVTQSAAQTCAKKNTRIVPEVGARAGPEAGAGVKE